jgi:hypothetical protein
LVSSDFRGTHNHQSQKTRAFCFFLETAVATAPSQFFKRSSNLLIDKGAQRNFITLDLVKQLKLKPIRRESLFLIGFTSCRGVSDFYDVVQLSLIDRQGSPILIEAIAIPHILDPLSDPYRKDLLKLPLLKNLLLAHPGSTNSIFSIDILIGADFYWDIVGDQVVRGPGPTAVQSKIGYLISGRLNNSNMHISVEEKFDVARFWQLETIGIQPDLESIQTTQSYQEKSVEFRDVKYIARLPWSDNHPYLLSNFQACQKRTRV